MLLKDIIFNEGDERSMWNETAIENRREQLIKFAIDQWKDL